MKRSLLTLSIIASILFLAACVPKTDTVEEPPQVDNVIITDIEEVVEPQQGKIAIITHSANIDQESYYAARAVVEKYGEDTVFHEVWPEQGMLFGGEDMEDMEDMEAILDIIAAMPEVKVLILHHATRNMNIAVDKLLETRSDILIIYSADGYFDSKGASEAAQRADIALSINVVKMGQEIAGMAYEAGAKVFVWYCHVRYDQNYVLKPIIDGTEALIKFACERLGIEFVVVAIVNELIICA